MLRSIHWPTYLWQISNGPLATLSRATIIAWPTSDPALLVDSFEFMTTSYSYLYFCHLSGRHPFERMLKGDYERHDSHHPAGPSGEANRLVPRCASAPDRGTRPIRRGGGIRIKDRGKDGPDCVSA